MLLQIELPQQIEAMISTFRGNYESFILDAIKEKFTRENMDEKNILTEGYINSREEDIEICNEFEMSDFENIK